MRTRNGLQMQRCQLGKTKLKKKGILNAPRSVILMGALKSIRKTADSKHCSVHDSRSFFTYYCCHSASGLMAIWKMSQIEREREKQGMDFCLRSSDFCLSSSTVSISDDSRCPQTPLKMM